MIRRLDRLRRLQLAIEHMLQSLQSQKRRGRVHVALNKGETKNALGRAGFFNRLGELRDRNFEN